MDTVMLGSQEVTIYGNPSDANLLQLRTFGSTVLLEPIGPIEVTCEVRAFSIATKYMGPAELSVLVIYERDEDDVANSTLVAQSPPWTGGTGDTHQFRSVDLLNGTILEGGKRYLIGLHGNATGVAVPSTAYDVDQGTETGEYYRIENVPYTGTAPPTLQGLPYTIVTRYGSVYVETVPLGLRVDDVNGDGVILSGGPIVITGQLMDNVDTVTVGGYPLTVISATTTIVECEPFDVLTSSVPLGGSVKLVVDDGTSTADTDVRIAQPAEIQYVVVANRQPYLSQGLSVVDGDQMAVVRTLGGSTLTLLTDTDVIYTPAVADGATHVRYWYDASAGQWDSGQVTINGGAAPGVPSISMFTVLVDTIGEATLKGKTDTTSGTVYAVVDASPTKPTNEQVRDGLNAAGAPALGKGSAPVTTADLSVTITGLPSDTLLYGWLAQWV